MADLPEKIRVLNGTRNTRVYFEIAGKTFVREIHEHLDESLSNSIMRKQDFEVLLETDEVEQNDLLLINNQHGKEVN